MTKARANAGWAVAIVATLGMSVSYIDRQTLAAIAPSVTSALRIDNAHYGWLLSAFSFAYLVFAPLAGILVDRIGARRGFTVAILCWSVVASGHAFASSFFTLFCLRVLLGTTESPSFPAAAQAIRRGLPTNRQPLAYGLLFTGSSVGAVLAAKIAVPLDATYGYRWAFIATALLGLSWLPVWLLVTRGRGLDGSAKIEKGPGPRPSWFSLVTSAEQLRSIVAIVGSAPALMFCLNWVSKYLVEGWGMPKAEISNLLVFPPLAFDIGAIGFGALASRGRGPKNRTELLSVALAMAASLALAPLASSPTIAVAICAIGAIGGAGIYALVSAELFARVPVEQVSSASGILASSQSLAYVVAGPLVGWSIDRSHGYSAAIVALGVIVIPTTLAFIAWPRKRDDDDAPAPTP